MRGSFCVVAACVLRRELRMMTWNRHGPPDGPRRALHYYGVMNKCFRARSDEIMVSSWRVRSAASAKGGESSGGGSAIARPAPPPKAAAPPPPQAIRFQDAFDDLQLPYEVPPSIREDYAHMQKWLSDRGLPNRVPRAAGGSATAAAKVQGRAFPGELLLGRGLQLYRAETWRGATGLVPVRDRGLERRRLTKAQYDEIRQKWVEFGAFQPVTTEAGEEEFRSGLAGVPLKSGEDTSLYEAFVCQDEQWLAYGFAQQIAVVAHRKTILLVPCAIYELFCCGDVCCHDAETGDNCGTAYCPCPSWWEMHSVPIPGGSKGLRRAPTLKTV